MVNRISQQQRSHQPTKEGEQGSLPSRTIGNCVLGTLFWWAGSTGLDKHRPRRLPLGAYRRVPRLPCPALPTHQNKSNKKNRPPSVQNGPRIGAGSSGFEGIQEHPDTCSESSTPDEDLWVESLRYEHSQLIKRAAVGCVARTAIYTEVPRQSA